MRAVINGNPVWLKRSFEGKSGDIDSFVNVISNQILTIVKGQGIIGIQPNGSEVPVGFNLFQSFLNPFNPVTKIKFDLPAANNGSIVIYDAAGSEAAVLVNPYAWRR